MGVIWLSLGIAGFILFFFGIGLGYQYRWWFRGKYIYLRKMFRGEAVAKDRESKACEVVIQLPNQGQPFRTRTENLSPNGMFIRMDPPLMKGDNFRFLLNLSIDESVAGTAEVRWNQTKASARLSPGMGCKFFQMNEKEKLRIRKHLRS